MAVMAGGRPAPELRREDLMAVLEATGACARARNLATFADLAVQGLHQLIPCDLVAYNEIDPVAADGWGRAYPGDVAGPEDFEVLNLYATDNPLVVHAARAPGDAPRSWSEMTSPGELERTDLYNLLYRPMGVTDQMAAALEGTGRQVVGLVVNRGSGHFSDRDRAVLDLYRGGLTELRRLVLAHSAMGRGLSAAGCAMVSLSHDGSVRSVGGDGVVLEAAGLDGEAGRLPGGLHDWVRVRRRPGRAPVEAEWTWEGPAGTFVLRWLPGPGEDLLLLRQAPPGDGGAAARVSVAVLGGFSVVAGGHEVSLSGRVAEVLKVVAVAGGRLHVEAIVEALWPDVDADVGRSRLRTVLARVPRSSAGRLLVREGDTVSLPAGASLDSAIFESAAVRALAGRERGEREWETAAAEALSAYGGDLVAEDPGELWAVGPRERLRRRQLALLDALAEEAARRDELSRAVSLLERAIEVDPVDESRYLRAAEALGAQGRRGAALAMVGRARSVLAELGLRPPAQLTALEADLRR